MCHSFYNTEDTHLLSALIPFIKLEIIFMRQLYTFYLNIFCSSDELMSLTLFETRALPFFVHYSNSLICINI